MRINSLIKILTFSDILILSGWGLINPVFAVFVTEQVAGGSLETVGFATFVYLIVKSVFQLPFARLIDSRKGEVDDFVIMAVGSFIMALVPFLYIFASNSVQILVLQGILGFGSAMTMPAWLAIFTRHIDKNIEAEEWGIYNAMVGVGGALTGALGGFMAEEFGFRPLFLIVGIVSILGTGFLFFIYQDLRMEEKKLASRKLASSV